MSELAINERIKAEICYKTLEDLSDAKLMKEYEKCKSVKREIDKLTELLLKHTDKETTKKIIEEYSLQLIPAGTKGVIRGNRFNKIVEERIKELNLDDNFEIFFESNDKENKTSEKPDWYIKEKSTNKIIIGMNQLDLWSGGAQTNRGSKYIEGNKHNTENSKLLCVVCNEIQFKSKNNKAFNFFKIGFENDTLCYLNNLKNIIVSYFKIATD
jgi:hypothetical protein